jgi:hypothetical protein
VFSCVKTFSNIDLHFLHLKKKQSLFAARKSENPSDFENVLFELSVSCQSRTCANLAQTPVPPTVVNYPHRERFVKERVSTREKNVTINNLNKPKPNRIPVLEANKNLPESVLFFHFLWARGARWRCERTRINYDIGIIRKNFLNSYVYGVSVCCIFSSVFTPGVVFIVVETIQVVF